MNPIIVAIIGINSSYGKWLTKLLEKMGCRVVGSDRDTVMTHRQAVEQADVVIFSWRIRMTVDIVREVLPYVRAGQLLMDVTSIKTPAVQAMLKSPCEVVGLHPMSAPTRPTLQGQKLIVDFARVSSWKGWVDSFIAATEATVVERRSAHHDLYMAVVQNLLHYSLLLAGPVFRRLGIDPREAMEFASPVYMVWLSLIGRYYRPGSSPTLYADLQTENPYKGELLEAIREEGQKLSDAIAARDEASLVDVFNENQEFFGQDVITRSADLFGQVMNLMVDLASPNKVVVSIVDDRAGVLAKLAGLSAELGINLKFFHTHPADKLQFIIGLDRRVDAPEIQEFIARIRDFREMKVVD